MSSSPETFRVACVQLTSRDDVEENLATCRRLVADAAAQGAKLVVLPENFAHLGTDEQKKLSIAETLDGTGPIERTLTDLARRHGVWLIGGGMPERAPGTKVWNTLVVVDPSGKLVERYRKIHLFDVNIPSGAQHTESATVEAGIDARVIDTTLGKVGLSICYDLRFPELYRRLTIEGARLIVVPAAFTLITGKDHWHPLLRARAIENQVYVVAAGQFGKHNDRRMTYGHSMIVDPWGTIVAEAPDRECAIVAEVDPGFQDKVRRELPCLTHRRL